MSRTFVMGDIHGAHRALLQVLDRCGFDRESDRLIFLGDVADGWPETRECIDELLGIPNLVHLLGNHDEWLLEWIDGGGAGLTWLLQGGKSTYDSYGGDRKNVPETHRDYLRTAKLWHQEDDRVFLHGGWSWHLFTHPMADPDNLTWDRELWNNAVCNHGNGATRLTNFREVYIGHTSTTLIGEMEPALRCEVWNLDQGAGWEGKLSIMDIETKEFWQSDVVTELYPEEAGRRGAA